MKIFESSIENLINIKKNVYFTLNVLKENFIDRGESHNYWEMVYVTKGSIIEVSNNDTTTVHENEIIFHAPNEFHLTKLCDSKYAEAYYISFVCTSSAMEFFRNHHSKLSAPSKDIMQKLLSEGAASFRPVLDNGRFHLAQSPDMPLGGQQMYKNYLEQLLITIMRENQLSIPNSVFPESTHDLHMEVCDKICAYLSDNVYSNVSLDDLCKKFNYSRTFLCSKFRKLKGISIRQYYSALKISEACELLVSQKHSISHIAELLNYGNQYSFSRAFKQIMGLSPLQYKTKRLEMLTDKGE